MNLVLMLCGVACLGLGWGAPWIDGFRSVKQMAIGAGGIMIGVGAAS